MSDMLTFIKRRFSSTDLTSESPEMQSSQPRTNGQFATTSQRNQSVTQPYQRYNTNMHRTTELSQTAAISAREQMTGMPNTEATTQPMVGSKKVYPSAPSSPSRSAGNFGSQMAGNASSNYFAGSMSQLTKGIFSAASTAANTVRDKTAIVTGSKTKVLLVIDEPFVDWAKVFRGRRIMDDYEIKVEQASFNEISISSHLDMGCVCTITSQSSKQTRSFKPDFVLIRQNATDVNNEWSNIIIGLAIGQVYSLNSLSTVLHMKNDAWVLAHLLQIRNFLGKENFPLLSKSYHSSNKELNNIPPLPCVVKIGDGHFGDAKMKIDNANNFQDLASVTSVTDKSIIVENFVEAKCDFIVQKIGSNYRAFLRKSISGNWKVNVGSSMLEKVPMNEKLKTWVDEVSKLFGGLDICSVHGVISKTGEYHIIGASGSDTILLGETQEDDRRMISEMVVNKWNSLVSTRPMPRPLPKSPSVTSGDMMTSSLSQSAMSNNPLPPPPNPTSSISSVVQKPSTYSNIANTTNSMPTSSLFNKGPSAKTPTVDSGNDIMTRPVPSTLDQQPMRSTYSSSMSSHGLGNAVTPTAPLNPSGATSSLFSQRNTSLEMSSTSSSYQPKPSLFSSTTLASSANSEQLPPPPPPPAPQMTNQMANKPAHSLHSTTKPQQPAVGSTGEGNLDETDDTMKNLRKTFAGIFGDM